MGRRVLEVGSGIGGTTQVLCDESFVLWLGLEPDQKMANRLQDRMSKGEFPSCCKFRHGDVWDLNGSELFDTVLYSDVLEHIDDDAGEIRKSAQHLRVDGNLIVIAPAHQFLYSEFDKAVGHRKRYDRRSLEALTPEGLVTRNSMYLDSVGLVASIGNRFLLHSPQPTRRQLWLWDKILVRMSIFIDPMVRYSFGRSILHVWQRVEDSLKTSAKSSLRSPDQRPQHPAIPLRRLTNWSLPLSSYRP